MAYSEELDRLLSSIVRKDGMVRKKMFGGTCYMWKDRMLCGVSKDSIILKIGIEEAAKAIAESKGAAFDGSGRPMKGWIMVDDNKITRESIEAWIGMAKRNASKAVK
jgi:hypothetical protein